MFNKIKPNDKLLDEIYEELRKHCNKTNIEDYNKEIEEIKKELEQK